MFFIYYPHFDIIIFDINKLGISLDFSIFYQNNTNYFIFIKDTNINKIL